MEKRNKEIEQSLLNILDSGMFMSIAQITKELKKRYNLKVSPQITKRYLLKLEKEEKITRKNG